MKIVCNNKNMYRLTYYDEFIYPNCNIIYYKNINICCCNGHRKEVIIIPKKFKENFLIILLNFK